MSKVLITRSKLDHLANTISAKSGVALLLTIAQTVNNHYKERNQI